MFTGTQTTIVVQVGRVNLDPNLDRSHLSAMQLNADGSLLAVTMDLGIVAVYELSALRPGCVSTILPPVHSCNMCCSLL